MEDQETSLFEKANQQSDNVRWWDNLVTYPKPQWISIRTQTGIDRIKTDQIECISIDFGYVQIFRKNGNISLKQYSDKKSREINKIAGRFMRRYL